MKLHAVVYLDGSHGWGLVLQVVEIMGASQTGYATCELSTQHQLPTSCCVIDKILRIALVAQYMERALVQCFVSYTRLGGLFQVPDG